MHNSFILHVTFSILQHLNMMCFSHQLLTCIPFLWEFAKKRGVFYCHLPDKLLANGEYVEGKVAKWKVGLLKRMYWYPMDWWEEFTMIYLSLGTDILSVPGQVDITKLANSHFTAWIFNSQFRSIQRCDNTSCLPLDKYGCIWVKTWPDVSQRQHHHLALVKYSDWLTFLSLKNLSSLML